MPQSLDRGKCAYYTPLRDNIVTTEIATAIRAYG